MEQTTRKGQWQLWVGLAVGLACLAIVFIFFAKPGDIIDNLRHVHLGYLLLGALGVVLFLVIRAVRWRFMLTGHDDDGGPAAPPYAQVFHIQNIGYMLTQLLPLRLGDVARAILIGNVPPVTIARGLSTMVVERLLYTMVNEAALILEEGIAYRFDHAGSEELMVLFDANTPLPAFVTMDGGAVEIQGPEHGTAETEVVRHFDLVNRMQSTSSVVRDFDWTQPALDLTREDAAFEEGEGHPALGELLGDRDGLVALLRRALRDEPEVLGEVARDGVRDRGSATDRGTHVGTDARIAGDGGIERRGAVAAASTACGDADPEDADHQGSDADEGTRHLGAAEVEHAGQPLLCFGGGYGAHGGDCCSFW